MVGIIGLIGKWLGWRFSPREKVDVQKVQSDIRIDEANINSKKLDDEIKVSQQALEWTAQFAAQLEKANNVIDKLQMELERLRTLNQQMRDNYEQMRDNYEKQMDALQSALEEERKHCKRVSEELEVIKKLYGHK